jgi:putative ABC transport system permease protein
MEAWVPPENSDALQTRLQQDLSSSLGKGVTVDVTRNDYAAWQDVDPFLLFQVVFGAVAILVLVLGALSLLTISLVTVQQRVREIGIRRSFGATGGRIFFAVMMESVVGTVLAGLLGVLLAAVIIQGPWMEDWLRGITGMAVDPQPFPIEAALVGLLAAVIVGALAGLMPAVVAIRIRVIDAIRF